MQDITDPVHLKARVEFMGAEAGRWKKHHSAALAALPEGTEVIIDLISGEYVTGADWQAADEAYMQRFGNEDRLSHSYTVGRPIFVGGGLWLK